MTHILFGVIIMVCMWALEGHPNGIQRSVNSNSQEPQLKEEAQKALNAIGSKHTLSVSYKRAIKGQHVFNNGLNKFHSKVLEDLMKKVGDWGRGEELLKLDLNPLDQNKRDNISEMVAKFSEDDNYVDCNADLYGHFVNELREALVAFLNTIIFYNKNDTHQEQMRVQMRERVQLIANAMANYDVYVDPMARDRWLQENRGREQQYNDVREALKVMFQNILQDFKQVIRVYRPDIKN